MILHLLGSNGAGKSTLVRAVMRDQWSISPVFVDGRQKALYNVCRPRQVGGRHLTIVGHYEIECGGADTIRYWSTVLEIIDGAARRGDNVLLEGPTGREYGLRDYGPGEVWAVWLQPSTLICVNGVRARGANINRERIERSMSRCRRITDEYEERGVRVGKYEDRTEALHAVQSILRRAQ